MEQKNLGIKIFDSVMAGVYVALGATAYCMIPDKVFGALFFAVGIFLVFNFNKMLFTRVVPLSVLGKSSIADAVISFFGNAVGATLYALLLYYSRLTNPSKDTGLYWDIPEIADLKLEDNVLSLFILGIFAALLVGFGACILMQHYKERPGTSVFFCLLFVATFVICGFEHVVADFFYFAYYSLCLGFETGIIVVIFTVGLGNLAGGLLAGLICRLREKTTAIHN